MSPKKKSIARAAVVRRGTARCAVSRCRTRPETGVGRSSQSAQDADNARSNVRVEILKQLLLLLDEIAGDPRAKLAALAGRAQRDRPAVLCVGALLDIPFLDQRRHDATRRALVQEQPLCQATQSQWTVLDQRLQRIALRDGDVVAADPIPVAKLIDAH